MNFIFDVETSGLPTRNATYKDLAGFDTARIVSISWILTQGDRITEQSYYIIKPDNFEICPEAQQIHGISMEQANNEGIPIKQMFKELKSSLQYVHSIISYNIDFDINVLKSELYRYKIKSIIREIDAKHHICCMKKAKEYLNMTKFPKLAETYKLIFNEEIQNAHNAMADTINCFKCHNKMFPLSRDIFFIKNRKIELTPEQSIIVFAPINMNISVLASAGSGKTSTITARIKYLIDEGIAENEIMLTTFTRDSANDMKQKLLDILGYKSEVVVGTIDTISKIQTYHTNTQQKLKDVSEHAINYLDFIKENPTVISKYKYLFIDEFQDINELQFNIIKEFSKNGTWIFAVGDDHQNIYSFRGSNIEYIMNFKHFFPENSDVFKLTYNFRSTREIINFANAIMDNSNSQILKKMIPGIPQDTVKQKPMAKYFENVATQNNFVVNQIVKLLQNGIHEDEIAILSPLNQSLFLIEELLIKKNIKCVYLDSKSDVRTMKKSGHICLCTIHKSKGLEWDYVFLTNMSDELIPRLKSPKNIDEDRRLFYVGVTRARQELYLYYSSNTLTPYVSRYISEVSREFYEFIDYKNEYTNGLSTNDSIVMDQSVTKLIDNLNGDDYIKLKELGIMPIIDMKTIEKIQIYEPYTYINTIEKEQLYTDFGTFIDVFISREVSKAFNIKNAEDTRALQALSSVILDKSTYQIYRLYRNNFVNNIKNIDSIDITKPKVISILNNGSKIIANIHIDIIYDIVLQIKYNAVKYHLPMNKIPIFNEYFLPTDFVDSMESHLKSAYSNQSYSNIIDDIWEVSKCHAIVTSYRRRLLFMNIRPSIHFKNYDSLFENINTKFIDYLKMNFNTNQIHIHEEFVVDDGMYGELDLRIGDTIIDYKNTHTDEITAAWILQLLCYKSMYDKQNDNIIKNIAIFNPLKGWYCSFDISYWNKQDELIKFLLDKRETMLTAAKH